MRRSTYLAFSQWLDAVLCQSLPQEVVAFCFNLYEGDGTFHIQLVGTPSFSDDDSDWACDEVFSTGENVFVVDRTIAGIDWPSGLQFCKAMVTSYLEEGSYRAALTNRLAVAIGYVDGDLDVLYCGASLTQPCDKTPRDAESGGRAAMYYRLDAPELSSCASAFAPESTPLAWELALQLGEANDMPFAFSLVKLTAGKKGLQQTSDLSGLKHLWLDYLPNSLVWPLCSQRMMAIIAEHLTGNEGIDWIGAKVNGAGEQHEYFVLRFTKMLDVLNMQNTIFVPGSDYVRSPCFTAEKIQKYSVFHIPDEHGLWRIPTSFYVSAALKTAIKNAGLTGVRFDKAKVM